DAGWGAQSKIADQTIGFAHRRSVFVPEAEIQSKARENSPVILHEGCVLWICEVSRNGAGEQVRGGDNAGHEVFERCCARKDIQARYVIVEVYCALGLIGLQSDA